MKFLLTFTPVDEFPNEPPESAENYAFVEAGDVDGLARTISVALNGEVVTDTGVYFPQFTSLPTNLAAVTK